MTPNDIDVLLHHHVCAAPHPRLDAPAVQNALKHFVNEGVLLPCNYGSGYATTERGVALVRALCRTELPVQRWVDSNGNAL